MSGLSGWRPFVESPPAGSHILFWSHDPATVASVIETFLNGALARKDLVALVVPRGEHADLHRRHRPQGTELDVHIARGDLIVAAAEEFLPRDERDEDAIVSLLEVLTDLAGTRGSSGLSFVGRIAPSLFEAGSRATAEMVERVLHGRRGEERWLCPYMTRRLSLRQVSEAGSLVSSRTHTITSLTDGQLLVEDASASEWD